MYAAVSYYCPLSSSFPITFSPPFFLRETAVPFCFFLARRCAYQNAYVFVRVLARALPHCYELKLRLWSLNCVSARAHTHIHTHTHNLMPWSLSCERCERATHTKYECTFVSALRVRVCWCMYAHTHTLSLTHKHTHTTSRN